MIKTSIKKEACKMHIGLFDNHKADFTIHRYVSRDRHITPVIDAIRYYPRRYPIGRDPIALSDATIFTCETVTAHIYIIAFFTSGLDLNMFYLNEYNFSVTSIIFTKCAVYSYTCSDRMITVQNVDLQLTMILLKGVKLVYYAMSQLTHEL